ncbi:MAG: DUF4245 domain-containing protein [Gordonia sp. (in: high G+C Gram-positive bacteria)]|uniref:DUF4245 domain-containing protein n=1 Tax=Gordonia sp. (in: high G+C Gram-positive bacteria) TaxID=84139 RepID=UPI0039E376C3
MAEKKPRILQDSRDMVWSLIPLLVICVVIAGVAGSCHWSFGDEASEQKIPEFNSAAAFRADARLMSFPIREPAVPKDWRSNSGSTSTVGGSLTSNVGWITAGGAYVQLSQSGAPEESLVRGLGGDQAVGAGTREVGGQTWVTYRNADTKRKLWLTDLGDVRIGVLSRGSDETMETLAKATLSAQPLPKK